MKKYITGDTHGDIDRYKLKSTIRFNKELTLEDILIIAGDWGVFFGSSFKKEEKFLLDWYKRFPCTVLIVDGNHDCHPDLLAVPQVELYGSTAGQIADNIYHLRRGHIYNIGGETFFIFGGALSADKADRTIGIDWWPTEMPSKEETELAFNNLETVGNKVDYIVTHTGPRRVLKDMGFANIRCAAKYSDPTAIFLSGLSNTVEFKQWFFGHMHVDKETENGKFVALYQKVYLVE